MTLTFANTTYTTYTTLHNRPISQALWISGLKELRYTTFRQPARPGKIIPEGGTAGDALPEGRRGGASNGVRVGARQGGRVQPEQPAGRHDRPNVLAVPVGLPASARASQAVLVGVQIVHGVVAAHFFDRNALPPMAGSMRRGETL